MPIYQLDNALGAGLANAAGFMAGQTDKKRYKSEQERQALLDAQAQADTQARLALQRSNQEATNAYRASTLAEQQARTKLDADRIAREDAAAVAAAQKQKLIDTFRGQGLHYPQNWAKMKPEQKIAYLQVRLNAAQKAGDEKTVSNTETEINRVATEAAAAQRQADLEKQRGVQNAMGQQRIQISIDRGNRADANRASSAGDPASFADVSARLHRAKNRDEAQAVLDSPEGSLLSDRQYNRLQKQVDETFGTHAQSVKKVPPERATLAAQANDAIKRGGDRDKIMRDYATRARITVKEADAELDQ